MSHIHLNIKNPSKLSVIALLAASCAIPHIQAAPHHLVKRQAQASDDWAAGSSNAVDIPGLSVHEFEYCAVNIQVFQTATSHLLAAGCRTRHCFQELVNINVLAYSLQAYRVWSAALVLNFIQSVIIILLGPWLYMSRD